MNHGRLGPEEAVPLLVDRGHLEIEAAEFSEISMEIRHQGPGKRLTDIPLILL